MASDTSVYISNESIHIIKAAGTGKSFSIKDIHEEKIEGSGIINGVITDSYVIRDALKKAKISAKSIKLVIDGSSIITKVFEAPLLKNNKLMPLIMDNFTDIENHGNMIADYMVLNEKNANGGATLLTTLVERDFLSEYVELFESEGLKIESIDISLGCLIRYVKSIGSLKNETFVFSVFDKHTVTFVLFVEGEYRFSRRIRIMDENNEDEMFDELVKTLLNMIQFNKSEKTNHDITDFFFGGFRSSGDPFYGKLAGAVGVNVDAAPKPLVKYNGSYDINDYIYAIGNMMN